MVEKKASLCPVCAATPSAAATLVVHCTSPTCTWRICRNKACDAVLDIARRRGHALGSDGKTRRKVTL